MTTLCSALDFYSTIKADDGYWPGDYGGPMFLLPGLVRLNKAISDSDLSVNVEITNVFSVA